MEIRQGGVVPRLPADVAVPRMFRAEQVFPREHIAPGEIPSVVERELSREPFRSKIRPGMTVAVTAGSRGIANVDIITRAVADFIRARGAFARMPSLLAGEGDMLVVDETGKNYSGTGVDPNITGTFSAPCAHGGVKVRPTCVLDLSAASHGNALGVGLADVITRRFFDKIDPEMMYPNCITSTVLASARIPCVAATDREAIQMCLRTCNGIDRARARVIRIPNSLHIGRIMLSEAYYRDVQDGRWPGLIARSAPEELSFDPSGALTTPVEG